MAIATDMTSSFPSAGKPAHHGAENGRGDEMRHPELGWKDLRLVAAFSWDVDRGMSGLGRWCWKMDGVGVGEGRVRWEAGAADLARKICKTS